MEEFEESVSEGLRWGGPWVEIVAEGVSADCVRDFLLWLSPLGIARVRA